ncbi:MAG: FecR family protein [Elusimicrobiota bacterium]|jgi:hypothetical protein
MKKILPSLKRLLAASLALLLAAPVGAAGPVLTQIGVAGAVSGKVMAFTPTQVQAKAPVGREVLSGKPLFLNEKVTTDAKGRMQVMLNDETTFTLGPNAAMVLDEFVYDPGSGAGEVAASVTRGAFRFVTGKIGAKDPSKVKVKFPTGTMGIRGTIVAGQVNEDGSTTAVLLGPGADNNAGERPGAFNLSNDGGSVDVNQPGFGSTMGSDGAPPTPPALIPSQQLGSIMGSLEAPDQGADSGGGDGGASSSSGDSSSSDSGDGSGGDTASSGDSSGDGSGGDTASGGDATGGDAGMGGDTGGVSSLAGQDTAMGGDFASDFGSVSGVSDVSDSVTETAAADSGDSAVAGDAVADGASTWEDVRTVDSGVGYYGGVGKFTLTDCNGAACGNPVGMFAYLLEVDFGSQKYSAAAYVWGKDDPSQLEVNDYGAVLDEDYAGLTGGAVVRTASDSGYFTADFSLMNSGDKAAASVEVSAVYSYSQGGFLEAGLGTMDVGAPSDYTYGSGSHASDQIGGLIDTAWESVLAVPSGVGVYAGAGYFQLTQCNGQPCVDPKGVFAYLLRIDFGAKTYGGGESGASFLAMDDVTGTSVSYGFDVPETDFSGMSGSPATLPTLSGTANSLNIDFTLKDADGTAGTGVDAFASYNDGSTIGSGSSSAMLYPSDGFTSLWSGVRTIASGAGMYAGEGSFLLTSCGEGACVDPSGSFSYAVYVDFGNRKFGGQGSAAVMNASDVDTGVDIVDSAAIAQTDFAGLSGKAEVGAFNNWTFTSESGYFGIDFSLLDSAGASAGELMASAYYDDDGGIIGRGWSFVDRTAVSDWDAVKAIPSGTAWYSGWAPLRMSYCGGNDCVAPFGTFHYGVLIDFGAKTTGGGGSGASVFARDPGNSMVINDSVDLSVPESFAAETGPVVRSAVSVSGNLIVDFTLRDVAGVAAGGVDVAAKYLYDPDGLQDAGYALAYAASGGLPSFADGAAVWDDLRNVVTGAGRYGGWGFLNMTLCDGVACSAQGMFSYILNLDFGAMTYDVGGYVTAKNEPTMTSIEGHIYQKGMSFSGLNGAAALSAVSGGGQFGLDFTLSNLGGIAGSELDVAASYSDDQAGTFGAGTVQGAMSGLESSTWAGVTGLPYGKGMFAGRGGFMLTQCNGDVCTDPRGYFDYQVVVDFGNGSYGGLGSRAILWAYDPGDGFINPVMLYRSFDISGDVFGSGKAAFSGGDGAFAVDFTLRDVGGLPGMAMDTLATYNDGGSQGVGCGFDAFRSATDFSDMLDIPGGAGLFRGSGPVYLKTCSGFACTNASPVGSFDYLVYIDFNAKEFGGHGSGAWISASDSGTETSIQDAIIIQGGQGYSGANGLAYFGAQTSESGSFTMDFTLGGSGPDAASSIFAFASYGDGSTVGVGMTQGVRANVSDWAAVQALAGTASTGWYQGLGTLALSQCSEGDCANPNGYFRYGLLVDFANGNFGGGPSGAYVFAADDSGTLIDASVTFPSIGFGGFSGPASIQLYSAGNLSIDFSLKDVGGVAALAADIGVNYDDGATMAHGHDSALQADPLDYMNNPSTWADVLTVPGGTGQFQSLGNSFVLSGCEGGMCDSPSGSFDVTLDLDFGRRTYALNASMTASDANLPSFGGTISRSISDNGVFGSGAAAAVISGSNAGFTMDMELRPYNGFPAGEANASASFDDGVGTTGSGSAVSVPYTPTGGPF